MEERPRGPEGQFEPGVQDTRFLLLRWWDTVVRTLRGGYTRLVENVRGWYARIQERRVRRPAPPVPTAPDEEEIARWAALLGRPDDPVHARALDELVVIGRPSVPALIEGLQSETWIQVFRASEALGLIGDRRAVKHLKRLLDHPNSNVRWGAAEALGRIQSRWARGRLRRVAAEDESRTSWGETVAESAERAVANIDRTWVSWLINVLQVLFYLALCAAVVYAAYTFVQQALEQRAQVVPTVEPTPTATATKTPSPTATPIPAFQPIAGVVIGSRANVREKPDAATGGIIGVLHNSDEILIYGGALEPGGGGWWYLIRLVKINSPATDSPALEDGHYGWIHASLVAGVEAPEIVPTVQAIETIRAGVATPTPIGSSLDLPTPTPTITATVAPTVTVSPP